MADITKMYHKNNSTTGSSTGWRNLKGYGETLLVTITGGDGSVSNSQWEENSWTKYWSAGARGVSVNVLVEGRLIQTAQGGAGNPQNKADEKRWVRNQAYKCGRYWYGAVKWCDRPIYEYTGKNNAKARAGSGDTKSFIVSLRPNELLSVQFVGNSNIVGTRFNGSVLVARLPDLPITSSIKTPAHIVRGESLSNTQETSPKACLGYSAQEIQAMRDIKTLFENASKNYANATKLTCIAVYTGKLCDFIIYMRNEAGFFELKTYGEFSAALLERITYSQVGQTNLFDPAEKYTLPYTMKVTPTLETLFREEHENAIFSKTYPQIVAALSEIEAYQANPKPTEPEQGGGQSTPENGGDSQGGEQSSQGESGQTEQENQSGGTEGETTTPENNTEQGGDTTPPTTDTDTTPPTDQNAQQGGDTTPPENSGTDNGTEQGQTEQGGGESTENNGQTDQGTETPPVENNGQTEQGNGETEQGQSQQGGSTENSTEGSNTGETPDNAEQNSQDTDTTPPTTDTDTTLLNPEQKRARIAEIKGNALVAEFLDLKSKLEVVGQRLITTTQAQNGATFDPIISAWLKDWMLNPNNTARLDDVPQSASATNNEKWKITVIRCVNKIENLPEILQELKAKGADTQKFSSLDFSDDENLELRAFKNYLACAFSIMNSERDSFESERNRYVEIYATPEAKALIDELNTLENS